MDTHTLQLDGRGYPLSEISRAVVRYREISPDKSVSYRGRLTHAGGITASHLNRVAAEIRLHAQRASPAPGKGDQDDIPAAISSMVQPSRSSE